MANKTIKTRIQQKHDTEANWNSAAKAATPFIPLKGELIVYDADYNATNNPNGYKYERFKIGDGVTVVDLLPFAAYSRSEIDKLLQDMGSTATLNIGNGSGTGSLQQTNIQSMEENISSDSVQPVASANGATALGYATKASGKASFATGADTLAAGYGAFAAGKETKAYGFGSHTEGNATVAGDANHVYTGTSNPSNANDRIGAYAHAEGNSTTAYGEASHAEGHGTNAAVLCAHAEGARTTASGAASHAEGADTVASGNRAHAEGSYTIASGSYSHAEGFHTKAESGYMHAQGKYNKTTSGYAHVVGWGEDEDNRKDIHRLSTDGGAWFAGKLYSGNNEITTNLSNGYKVIDGNRTEIPGALRQCNLTLSLDSVKEYIIGKAYVKDECCWYNAGTEDVPVWELYRCTTSYGEAKTDTFIDLKDTYWELIDTSVEGFNFNNLKIPAQGYNPKAEGIGSFAVGYNTKAYKSYSFASGNGSVANKSGAHAEGYQTYADANASHTEGTFTQTHGDNSHAEGTNTVTTGHDAHAEGTDTGAAGLSSHTEGYQTIAGQFIEVITENLTIVNEDSIPTSTFAKGTCVKYVLANGSGYRVYYCPANNIVFSEDSWVRAWFVRDSIIDNITYQLYALAVSDKSQFGEHAEGYQTIAQGQSAHAEGTNTKALADFAHAEGQLTSATGVNAHAEGRSSSATKDAAHAEGVSTTASALAAHAEGQNTVAEGQASHAEGARTTASGAASHAEGADTVASGNRAHAEGEHTVASEAYQHVQGRYNIVDSNNKAGNYAHIVGNGTSIKRSNAHTLDWQGNAWFAGDVTVGTNKDKLATEEYVDTSVANLGKLTTQDVTDALGYTPANKQHTHPVSQIGNLSSQLDAKMPKAGGTFTGAISSSADKANGTAQFRNSIVASSVPSDLSALKVGDMIYVEGESSGGAGVTYTLSKSGSTITLTGSNGSTSSVSDSNNTYSAAGSSLGLVKSGGDVTISNGVISVNNDSHYHSDYTTEDRVIELIGMYATCLIEGTPINMADGTTKAIEDIEPGDLIKSYNPVTKELTDAVAIASVYTGANRNFTVHNFEDGRCVTTFGQHAVYDAVEGTTFDIQNITRSRRMINIDNEETLWADKRSISFHGKRKKRYGLISSNNLYFANGILLGHKPYNKLEHIEDRCKGIIDPEIRKVWEQDCDDYTAVTAVTDQSMYTELKDVYKEYAETRDQISKHKKLLSGSDYKSIKRNEGHIDDVEWLPIAADRQKWRNVINENEARYTGLKQQIDNALAARRPQGWTHRSLFEQCCARDNAAFELVKAYFEEQNSSAD